MSDQVLLRIKCCDCSRTTTLTLPTDPARVSRQLAEQGWQLTQVNYRSAEREQDAALREPTFGSNERGEHVLGRKLFEADARDVDAVDRSRRNVRRHVTNRALQRAERVRERAVTRFVTAVKSRIDEDRQIFNERRLERRT